MGAIGRYRQRYFGNSKANIHEGLFFNYNIKDFEKLSNGTALNDSLEGLSESWNHNFIKNLFENN